MKYYILTNLVRYGVVQLNNRKICFDTRKDAEYFIESMQDEDIKKTCKAYWLKYDSNSLDATGMTEHELLISEGLI